MHATVQRRARIKEGKRNERTHENCFVSSLFISLYIILQLRTRVTLHVNIFIFAQKDGQIKMKNNESIEIRNDIPNCLHPVSSIRNNSENGKIYAPFTLSSSLFRRKKKKKERNSLKETITHEIFRRVEYYRDV